VLIAISYWLTDMFCCDWWPLSDCHLKSSTFGCQAADLRTGIGWDLIFILINLYQIYRLVRDRLSLRLPEADRELLAVSSPDSTMYRSRGFSSPVSFCDLADGMALAEENQALDKTFLHLRRPR
jgi:hypothetical protein